VQFLRRLFGRGRDERGGDVMRERQTDQPGHFRDPHAEHRANKQQADTTGLVREGEPRGGMSAEAYNTAAATDVVVEEGVAMSGPGGAVQDETTPLERREDQRQ